MCVLSSQQWKQLTCAFRSGPLWTNLAATGLVWTAVIVNSSKTSGPFSNSRALMEKIFWRNSPAYRPELSILHDKYLESIIKAEKVNPQITTMLISLLLFMSVATNCESQQLNFDSMEHVVLIQWIKLQYSNFIFHTAPVASIAVPLFHLYNTQSVSVGVTMSCHHTDQCHFSATGSEGYLQLLQQSWSFLLQWLLACFLGVE